MIFRRLALAVVLLAGCHTPATHTENERETQDVAAENAASALQQEYKSLA